MILAGLAGRPPREIAAMIAERLPESRRVEKVEIAGPGFLNFFASDHHFRMVLRAVREQADDYGRGEPGSREDVLLEFVSANPTGPLHVGHGRGAAYGASLAAVMERSEEHTSDLQSHGQL